MPFYSNRSRGPKARGCATRKHASSNADYGSSSVRRVPSGDVEGDRPEGIALQMEKMRGDLRFWCVADPKDRHCFVTQWLRASLIPNETDPAHSSRMCVSWLCRSQISSPRHARVWENDTPPEAGPQWRAGSLVRQAEASEDRPGWWVPGHDHPRTVKAGVAPARRQRRCQRSYWAAPARTAAPLAWVPGQSKLRLAVQVVWAACVACLRSGDGD